jgi:TPR repeat protein
MVSNWGNSKNRAARYIAAAVYFPVEIREELASSLPSTEVLFPGPPEDEFVSVVQALARGKRVRSDAVDEITAHVYWVGDDGWQGVIVPTEGLRPRPPDSTIAHEDGCRYPTLDGQMRSLTASHAAEELSELTTAADAGDVEAKYRLGWLLSQRGEARGRDLLLSAALAGHPNAMNDVGLAFARAGDAVEAEKWYRQGARMGHVLCAYNLASLLLAAGNLEEAKVWFRVSAKAGDPDGATSLGALLFHEGKHDEAADWLTLGATGGNAQAAYNLGVYFLTKERQDEALRWFDVAAQLGDVDAPHQSGRLRAANPKCG